MKAFYIGDELYIRVIPGKNLFKSSMIHEVVNRGDIFALRVRDSILTIIPGTTKADQNLDVTTFINYIENEKSK